MRVQGRLGRVFRRRTNLLDLGQRAGSVSIVFFYGGIQEQAGWPKFGALVLVCIGILTTRLYLRNPFFGRFRDLQGYPYTTPEFGDLNIF